jgi:hypothetical protein
MQKEIQIFLTKNLGNTDFNLEPINKGGSDRVFFRVSLPDKTSFVFMHYGDEVAENAYWARVNKFMASLDINVPRVIAQDDKQHFILMDDLGEIDLWSHRFDPWEKRRDYYFQAFSQIQRLHSFDAKSIPAYVQLSESYGPRLYKWEHGYFLDNFVFEVCKIKLSSSDTSNLNKELEALSAHLQKIEPCLIHRDFQSQNIMIKNNQPVFIDFQGMRRGNFFYDLGSLICDPYVNFTDEERNELISFYHQLMPKSFSADEFKARFWEASAQRLMQALGAYGFLGLKKNKPDFLKHLHGGIRNLFIAASLSQDLPCLRELAQQCMNTLDNRHKSIQ